MELVGFVLQPVIASARKRIRVLAHSDPLDADAVGKAMQVVAVKCTGQSDHIQDSVEAIQNKDFAAAKSWMKQALAALGAGSTDRVAECMAKVEEEAQRGRHALCGKTPEGCRTILEAYALLMTAGYYSASKGGKFPEAGAASVQAYYDEACADTRIRKMLQKISKAQVYINSEEERFLTEAAKLDWWVDSKPGLRWRAVSSSQGGWKARLLPESHVMGNTEIGGHARHILRKSVLQVPPMAAFDLPPGVRDVALSPSGSSLVVQHGDLVGCWSSMEGMEEYTWEGCERETGIVMSPDGSRVAVVQSEGVAVLDLQPEKRQFTESHTVTEEWGVSFVTWAGPRLVTVDSIDSITVWTAEGEVDYSVPSPGNILAIAGGVSGVICVVNAPQDEECTEVVEARSWAAAEGSGGGKVSPQHFLLSTDDTSWHGQSGMGCTTTTTAGEDSEEAWSETSDVGGLEAGMATAVCAVVGEEGWVLLPPARSIHLASHTGGIIRMPVEAVTMASAGEYLCTGASKDGLVMVWHVAVVDGNAEGSLVHVFKTEWGMVRKLVGTPYLPYHPPHICVWGHQKGEEVEEAERGTAASFLTPAKIDEPSLLTKCCIWKLTPPSESTLTSSPTSVSPVRKASSAASPTGKRTTFRERASSLFPSSKRKSQGCEDFMEILDIVAGDDD